MQILGKVKALLLTLVLFSSFLLGSPLSNGVTGGPLVQQASGGCSTCSISSVASFGGDVNGGDLLVVGVSTFFAIGSSPPYTVTVTDTLGSTYTSAVNQCNNPGYANCASIFYATAPSTGTETVTVTVNNGADPMSIDIFIYELHGVTTAGATTGTGYGGGTLLGATPGSGSGASLTPSISISTSPVSFSAPFFLLGVVNIDEAVDPPSPFTPGAGFTASNPSGSADGFAQYALGGVASPTTFPGTLSISTPYWTEVALALSPPSVSTPVCPSTAGGALMPVGATFADNYGNTWAAPGGTMNGGTYTSYFFAGPQSSYPPPMISGWGGDYGTYGGQQGWIVTFYCL